MKILLALLFDLVIELIQLILEVAVKIYPPLLIVIIAASLYLIISYLRTADGCLTKIIGVLLITGLVVTAM